MQNEMRYKNGEAVKCPECGAHVVREPITWTGKTAYTVCQHLAEVIEEAIAFHVTEGQE